jgi:hypothetical protein
MQRKKRGDRQAAPAISGCLVKQKKEQDAVQRMKKHAGGVVSRGVQAEELAVGHVREPGQRSPNTHVERGRGKRPASVLPGKPGANVRIRRDIQGIVVLHKVALKGIEVSGQSNGGEQHGQKPGWQ